MHFPLRSMDPQCSREILSEFSHATNHLPLYDLLNELNTLESSLET